LGEQCHAAHWSVAGDREIRQEHELLRVPGIFDRADHADVELARHEQIIQLGGCARDELMARRQRHDATVDRAVDGRAVDVADAANSHSAPSTTVATGCLARAAARARCSIWKSEPCGAGPWGRTGGAGVGT